MQWIIVVLVVTTIIALINPIYFETPDISLLTIDGNLTEILQLQRKYDELLFDEEPDSDNLSASDTNSTALLIYTNGTDTPIKRNETIITLSKFERAPQVSNATIVTFSPKKSELYYTFSPDYHLQPKKQLVLFSTAEVRSMDKLKYDLVNHIRMMSFFQSRFNFTPIVFSNSEIIWKIGEEYNITIIKRYRVNRYGTPLIRDLFQQAYHLRNSRFYGYINSDIILSPTLFSFLNEVEQRIQNGTIPENIEIAGRVYNTVNRRKLDMSSLKGYKRYLQLCERGATYLRNYNSADYFIFPNSFDFSVMKDVVVGRSRIDNYLLSLMYRHHGYLIDTTERVIAFHLGTAGYLVKQRNSNQSKENMHWNLKFLRSVSGSRGSLEYALWKPYDCFFNKQTQTYTIQQFLSLSCIDAIHHTTLLPTFHLGIRSMMTGF